MPHMARAGLGRIRSAGPGTFARAHRSAPGPGGDLYTCRATLGRRPTRDEPLGGITLRDRTIRENARRAADLDRQSDCRYRARTAVRLAAGGKQALASLTSLCWPAVPASPLPCAFTPPPRSPTANDHEVLHG